MASSCPPTPLAGDDTTSPLQVNNSNTFSNYTHHAFQALAEPVTLKQINHFAMPTHQFAMPTLSPWSGEQLVAGARGTGTGAHFRPRLRKGSGWGMPDGGCLMQVAGFLADGVSWTDRPTGADEQLGGLGMSLNDYAADEARQQLLAFAPRLGVSAEPSVSRRADAWLQVAADEIAYFARAQSGPLQERLRALAQGTRDYLAGAGPVPSVVGVDLTAGLANAVQAFSTLLQVHASGEVPTVPRVAASLVWGLLLSHQAWATPLGRGALEVALDTHESFLGREKRTLEQVPGEMWERMARGMVGLAA